MEAVILIAFFSICAIILIPLALVCIFRFFSSNSGTNGYREDPTVATSPMTRLSERNDFAEQHKHDSLKTEFLQHWDDYVSSVTIMNNLIETIQEFWVDFLGQIQKLDQQQDQITAVSEKIQQLEGMKISIPVEKQRTVTELKLGTSYITDSVASTYQNEYIPELRQATESIKQAITLLRKDQQQLQDFAHSADDTTQQTYSV